MNRFWLLVPVIPMLLPLAACKDDGLKQLLNGSSATASNERTPYVDGSTATQAEVDRLGQFAPGQSTGAMHSVLGSPDSFNASADFYRTGDGSMIEVPYNSDGRWTGEIRKAEAPTWQASPYPGVQP